MDLAFAAEQYAQAQAVAAAAAQVRMFCFHTLAQGFSFFFLLFHDLFWYGVWIGENVIDGCAYEPPHPILHQFLCTKIFFPAGSHSLFIKNYFDAEEYVDLTEPQFKLVDS